MEHSRTLTTSEGRNWNVANGTTDLNTSYQDAQFKSVHNLHERRESLEEVLTDYHIRSLEYDIGPDLMIRGKQHPLASKLRIIKEFIERESGQNQVVTLFIDLHGQWAQDDVTTLDHTFQQTLGTSIFRRSQLLENQPSGEHQCLGNRLPWPSLKTLRGRVIIFLTGHSKDNQPIPQIEQLDLEDPTFFVGHKSLQDHTVLLNLNSARLAGAPNPCLITRSYKGTQWFSGAKGGFVGAKSAGFNHIATDKVHCKHNDWSFIERDPQWAPWGDHQECSSAKYFNTREDFLGN